MVSSDYYIYIYLDPRKSGRYEYGDYCFLYEPFYVGKGKGDRYLYHLKGNKYNHYLKNKINKIINDNLEPIIVKIMENLKEDYSFILESKLINFIGRNDLDKGPLTNMTDGGEGTSGVDHNGFNNPMFGKNHSEKTKNILSNKKKGSKRSVETKCKIKNTMLKLHSESDEIRNKISKGQKGRKLSDKHKKTLSNRMKGDNNPSRKYGISDSHRKKISDRMKGENHYFYGTKGPMFGRTHTNESKNRMRESKLGDKNPNFNKKLSKEKINKLIDSSSKKYKIIYPDGKNIIIKNLLKFCKDINISYWGMMRVMSNKQDNCQGFKCIRIGRW